MPVRVVAARPVDVLIVSTHEWTSRSLGSILAPRGYVVRNTYNRAQTLIRIRSNPPDAIIIDEELPDGDGYALCRQLNDENLISPSTPVFLALTRPPTRRDRLAALHANAWACLGEPLDAEELLAMLATLIPAKLDADQARSNGLMDSETGIYNQRGLTRRAEELAANATRRRSSLCCILLAPEVESTSLVPAARRRPSSASAPRGLLAVSRESAVDPRDPPAPALWVLRSIAATLRSTIRQSDVLGRIGATSFALVAIDADVAQARRLTERAGAAVLAGATRRNIPPLPPLRVRAGYHTVVAGERQSVDVDALMRHADIALRRARADSRDAWLQGYNS